MRAAMVPSATQKPRNNLTVSAPILVFGRPTLVHLVPSPSNPYYNIKVFALSIMARSRRCKQRKRSRRGRFSRLGRGTTPRQGMNRLVLSGFSAVSPTAVTPRHYSPQRTLAEPMTGSTKSRPSTALLMRPRSSKHITRYKANRSRQRRRRRVPKTRRSPQPGSLDHFMRDAYDGRPNIPTVERLQDLVATPR